MRRARRAPPPDVEDLGRFRAEVMALYKKFEEDLVAVSRKHGFDINMWYSPSKIPQPNFKVGKLLLDVDQLYHDQDFKELINQHYPLWNSTQSSMDAKRGGGNGPPLTDANGVAVEMFKKNVELRQRRPSPSYSIGLFDFRQGNGDMRLRRSRLRREDSF